MISSVSLLFFPARFRVVERLSGEVAAREDGRRPSSTELHAPSPSLSPRAFGAVVPNHHGNGQHASVREAPPACRGPARGADRGRRRALRYAESSCTRPRRILWTQGACTVSLRRGSARRCLWRTIQRVTTLQFKKISNTQIQLLLNVLIEDDLFLK